MFPRRRRIGAYSISLVIHYETFLPLAGLPPPLDRCLSLFAPELALELSAPPSVPLRCLLTSGFAGLTSRGLADS